MMHAVIDHEHRMSANYDPLHRDPIALPYLKVRALRLLNEFFYFPTTDAADPIPLAKLLFEVYVLALLL